eukprot:2438897-Prymnesium_polylepis.1
MACRKGSGRWHAWCPTPGRARGSTTRRNGRMPGSQGQGRPCGKVCQEGGTGFGCARCAQPRVAPFAQ